LYVSRANQIRLGTADRYIQGTTFSGVAFAFATNTEAKEDIIVEWPGAGTQTKQKVRAYRLRTSAAALS